MPDYGSLYQAAGNQWGIDPLLLQSMAREESDENPNAVGPTIQSGPAVGQRALGFMQFLPGTAKQYSVDTNNPSSSVYGASNYMADLLYKQNLPIRQALATYGGTAGNPNSDYVNTVMGRYKALKSAWSAPAATAPATDTDPSSPTYGQPTTRNFNPPAGAPAVDTTAKGNPGQPAPNVPTTDTGPGVSMAAPGLVPPEQGGPSGQRKPPAAPAAPDYLAPFKEGKPIAAAPAAPTSPAAAAPAAAADQPPDYLAPFKEGKPIGAAETPIDTGEYLTAPTSPGAKAVGAQPTGTPIAEGRVPGPDFQAAINLATDPAQKARIAGHWLFPNDPPDQAADRIIIGPGGRMAAVPDSGQPYFIEPAPIFNPQTGYTKVPGAFADVTAAPDWHQIGAAQVTPYSRAAPLGPGATATNIPLAMGGAIPASVQNALTWAPAGVGGPVVGSGLVGLASAGTTALRNKLANYFDPDQSRAVPLLTPEDVKQAGINALTNYGLRFAGGQFDQALNQPLEMRGVFGGDYGPNLGTSTQFPGRQPMPVGPGVPIEAKPSVPGAVVGAPETGGRAALAVMLDPMEGAADKSGPYAATTQAEIRAQPTTIAPPRFPIMTQNQVEERADEIIRHFASVGNTVPDTRPLITEGTLAQTTGNPGLAALERRVAADTPLGQTTFQAFRDAQLQARRDFTRNLVGTPDDLAALRQARAANTAQTKAAAFGPGETAPVDPQPVIDKIDQILRSPEGVRSAVADPLRQIRSWFYERDPITGKVLEDAAGNPIPIIDPERLYNVRRDIQDSKRGPMATSTQTDARAAAHHLGDVEKVLDDTITSGAPNYPTYMRQYADQSKEINAMEFLQGRNLTDNNGDTTLAKVDGAIKAAERQRDVEVRRRPADALSDDQMQQLYTLRDDLRRQANSRKGMDVGSPTVQNFSTSATYNALAGPMAARLKMLGAGALGVHTGGLSGILWGAAEPFIENALTGPSRRTAQAVDEAVIRRLLNRDGSGTRALLGQPEPGPGP